MALVLARDNGEVVLNGEHGEGGGQILRSAVALSVARGRALCIEGIRARRRPPGLRPQHLAAVRALRELCDAEVQGAAVGSSRLRFSPRRRPESGLYRFDIGTAGSTALLLHALVPALCTARPTNDGKSILHLIGGTHQPLAPSAGYLREVWATAAQAAGLDVSVNVVRPGFYPRGGGELTATVASRRPAARVAWLVRAGTPRVRARAGIAHLPRHIAERMLYRVKARLAEANLPFDMDRDGEIADHGVDPPSPGAYLELVLDAAPVPAGFFCLGKQGLPAEVVADWAVSDLLRHLGSDAPVDPHLSDQLAIILSLSSDDGGSSYRTSKVTRHLVTQAEVLGALWPVDVTIEGRVGHPGLVSVRPRSSADE